MSGNSELIIYIGELGSVITAPKLMFVASQMGMKQCLSSYFCKEIMISSVKWWDFPVIMVCIIERR